MIQEGKKRRGRPPGIPNPGTGRPKGTPNPNAGRRDGWRITGHLWGYDIIHDVKRQTEATAIVEFIVGMGGNAVANKVTMNAIIL